VGARPKIITSAQIVGEQGFSIVKERIHAMGYLFTPYGPVEAGIDGIVEIRDGGSGQVSGKMVAVQVKTTESGTYTAETDQGFEYLLRPEDFQYWQRANLPVIIAIVRLSDRSVYWKAVPKQGNPSDPASRKLRIDKSADVLSSRAREAIAEVAVDQAAPGSWIPASRQTEPLLFNGVRVVLPERIYVAATVYGHGRDVLRALLDIHEAPPAEWVARGGRLLSFLDPRNGPLGKVIDRGSVEDFPVSVFAFHDDETEERLFVELLNRTLRAELHPLLAWSDKARAFYFPAGDPEIERTYQYMSVKRDADRKIVAARRRPDGSIAYVRHSAFGPRFWKIFEEWYLLVQPTYVFTWDGFRPDRYSGTRISKLKRKERNASVRGQFVMWQSLLTSIGRQSLQLDMLASSPPSDPLLRFERIDDFKSPASLRDDLWKQRDEFAPDDNEEELPL
jgi:hypothetical protein